MAYGVDLTFNQHQAVFVNQYDNKWPSTYLGVSILHIWLVCRNGSGAACARLMPDIAGES